jgi:pilus assembly protein CpaC
VPRLKFPADFLPSNSGIPMNTPDAKQGSATSAQTSATMPVEKLIESLQPESPLLIEGTSSSASGDANGGSGASSVPK